MSTRRDSMSARKDPKRASMRRSIQPRSLNDELAVSAPAAATAAAAAAATPQTHAPMDTHSTNASSSSSLTAAPSTNSSSSSSSHSGSTGARSARVQLLTSLLSSTLLRAWHGDLITPHLSLLPPACPLLLAQRQCEKTLAAVRRNIMAELDVIVQEHALESKVAEVEFLMERGGVLLEDGSVLQPTGGPDAPPPEEALQALFARARRDEIERLQALAERQEEENAALEKEVEAAAAALQAPKEAVTRTQQHTDAVYLALARV